MDVCDGTTVCVVKTFIKRPAVSKIGFVVVGFGLGFGSGALLTRHILKTRYDQILEEEIEATKLHYKVLYKREGFFLPKVDVEIKNPEVEEVEKIIEEEGYFPPDDGFVSSGKPDPIPVEKLRETSWVFDESNVGPDVLEQKMPYLISETDFRENPLNHRQAEWVYYEEDQTLVDETDTIVRNLEDAIGDVDLEQFDQIAENGVLLYVRNERLDLDIVISIDYTAWSKAQLGFEEERTLEHEYRRDARKVRKFRSDHG